MKYIDEFRDGELARTLDTFAQAGLTDQEAA